MGFGKNIHLIELTAFGIVGLVALGIDFHEAGMGIYLLAFPVYLGLSVRAFAATSLARVWMVLASGAALMTLAAWAIQQTLVS